GLGPVFHDVLSWEYYAYAGNLRPGERARQFKDHDFLIRNQYFFIAHDAAEAVKMVDQSGIDPYLRKSFRQAGEFGRLNLYLVSMTPSVADDYHAATLDAIVSPRRTADVYTGLGDLVLKPGDVEKGTRLLARTAAIPALGPKAVLQLARAES